jgi:hypothetical protein
VKGKSMEALSPVITREEDEHYNPYFPSVSVPLRITRLTMACEFMVQRHVVRVLVTGAG